MATAIVAAVIVIQGTGSSVSSVSRASAVTLSVGNSASESGTPATKSAIAAVGTEKQSSTSARTSGESPAPSASSTVSADGAPSGDGSTTSTGTNVDVSGRTFTTTPAVVNAPAPPTQPAAPVCPAAIGGSTAGAPGASDPSGIPGTTSADLASFAAEYNALRVANCLTPIPYANIRYSSCLQDRMWWMADDPSTDPTSAWGHTGSAVRSDGVPIVGCDGDIAGGNGYTGATAASEWWTSLDHRASLYQPLFAGNVAGVCIAFAVSHGGVNVPGPNEPYSFVRAAAYWYSC
jgi:hypothetical protein